MSVVLDILLFSILQFICIRILRSCYIGLKVARSRFVDSGEVYRTHLFLTLAAAVFVSYLFIRNCFKFYDVVVLGNAKSYQEILLAFFY